MAKHNKTQQDNLDVRITFRLTFDESKKLERDAEEIGCTVSQLVRKSLFQKPAATTGSEREIAAALKKASSELNRLANFSEVHKDDDKNWAPILQSAKESMSYVSTVCDSFLNCEAEKYLYLAPPETGKDILLHMEILESAMEYKNSNGDKRLRFLAFCAKTKKKYTVISRTVVPIPLLSKGKKVMILGYYHKDNVIYANAIMICSEAKKQ